MYALDAIAKLYANMKDPEKALATIDEALSLSPLSRAPKTYASLIDQRRFALSALHRENEEAMQAYQRALKLAREASMPLFAVLCLANISDYYLIK
jgi:tetratricopeptide (TPR) repeat protein